MNDQRITAVAATVVALVSVTAIGVGWRNLRPADWVSVKALDHSCQTSTSEVECLVTNATPVPAKTCLMVVLQKKGTTERIRSVRACTGRLDSYESRTLRIPWGGQSTQTICSKGDQFDWTACEFIIEPI